MKQLGISHNEAIDMVKEKVKISFLFYLLFFLMLCIYFLFLEMDLSQFWICQPVTKI